jgi:hypothetical protein
MKEMNGVNVKASIWNREPNQLGAARGRSQTNYNGIYSYTIVSV